MVKLKTKLALSVRLLQDTCQAVICCALALNGADKLLNYEDFGALNDDCRDLALQMLAARFSQEGRHYLDTVN